MVMTYLYRQKFYRLMTYHRIHKKLLLLPIFAFKLILQSDN